MKLPGGIFSSAALFSGAALEFDDIICVLVANLLFDLLPSGMLKEREAVSEDRIQREIKAAKYTMEKRKEAIEDRFQKVEPAEKPGANIDTIINALEGVRLTGGARPGRRQAGPSADPTTAVTEILSQARHEPQDLEMDPGG